MPNAQQATLEAILTRRRQIVEMLVAEKNRSLMAASAVRKSLPKHIRWLERELGDIEGDIEKELAAADHSVPGQEPLGSPRRLPLLVSLATPLVLLCAAFLRLDSAAAHWTGPRKLAGTTGLGGC